MPEMRIRIITMRLSTSIYQFCYGIKINELLIYSAFSLRMTDDVINIHSVDSCWWHKTVRLKPVAHSQIKLKQNTETAWSFKLAYFSTCE